MNTTNQIETNPDDQCPDHGCARWRCDESHASLVDAADPNCTTCGGNRTPGVARWLCDCAPFAAPPRGPAFVAWVTWGSVRGEGPTRLTEEQAQRDARSDAHGCARQGGYSDRQVYGVDADGWARTSEGGYVWPHGRGTRALQVDLTELAAQAVRS